MALAVLSTFSSVPALAAHPEMQEIVPLLVKVGPFYNATVTSRPKTHQAGNSCCDLLHLVTRALNVVSEKSEAVQQTCNPFENL